MGRHKKNAPELLTIVDLAPGLWRMSGTIAGKRYREQSKDLQYLKNEKARIEKEALCNIAANAELNQLRLSVLTNADLTECESALHALKGSGLNLTQAVRYAVEHIGGCKPVLVKDALAAFWADQRARKLAVATIKNGSWRLRKFFENHPVAHVADITPPMIKAYVRRPGIGAATQLTDASTLSKFLNFCVHKDQGFIRSSPFSIDMAELADQSRKEAPDAAIITPEQTQAMLDAAIAGGGHYVPWVIFSLFCFMRSSEVARLKKGDILIHPDRVLVRIRGRKRNAASRREVTVPPNIVPLLKECLDRGLIPEEADETTGYGLGKPSFCAWAKIREAAGLLKVEPVLSRRKPRLNDNRWEANLLRHTGISYLYQKSGDATDVTRQAGNSISVAFEHYINLPEYGACDRFYAITGHLKPEGVPEPQPVQEMAS